MRAAFLAGAWLVFLGFWLLLVGTREWLEVIAGVCASALGALLAEGVRSHGLVFRVRGVPLAPVVRVPFDVFRDFALITWALILHLARVRPVRSAYLRQPFPGSDAPGRRAVGTIVATISPNRFVVDVDGEERVAFVHALVPEKAAKTVP